MLNKLKFSVRCLGGSSGEHWQRVITKAHDELRGFLFIIMLEMKWAVLEGRQRRLQAVLLRKRSDISVFSGSKMRMFRIDGCRVFHSVCEGENGLKRPKFTIQLPFFSHSLLPHQLSSSQYPRHAYPGWNLFHRLEDIHSCQFSFTTCNLITGIIFFSKIFHPKLTNIFTNVSFASIFRFFLPIFVDLTLTIPQNHCNGLHHRIAMNLFYTGLQWTWALGSTEFLLFEAEFCKSFSWAGLRPDKLTNMQRYPKMNMISKESRLCEKSFQSPSPPGGLERGERLDFGQKTWENTKIEFFVKHGPKTSSFHKNRFWPQLKFFGSMGQT